MEERGEGGRAGVDGGVVDGERGLADEVGIGVGEELGDLGRAGATEGEEDAETDGWGFVAGGGGENFAGPSSLNADRVLGDGLERVAAADQG